MYAKSELYSILLIYLLKIRCLGTYVVTFEVIIEERFKSTTPLIMRRASEPTARLRLEVISIQGIKI